ncbi:hypothetical protein [Amphritea atlantica]|nr:hypothetical protein [Amphritea atlantica]
MGRDNPELQYKFVETIALMEGVFLNSQETIVAGHVSTMYTVRLPMAYVSYARKMFEEYSAKGLDIIVNDIDSEYSNFSDCMILNIKGRYRFGLDHDIRNILESHGGVVEYLNQYHSRSFLNRDTSFTSKIRIRLTRPIVEMNLIVAIQRLSPNLKIEFSIDRIKGCVNY